MASIAATGNPRQQGKAERRKTFQLTFPLVRNVLAKHTRGLLMLGALSLLLGLVPTLQSEIESGVFEQVNNILRPSTSQKGATLREVVNQPLSRFTQTADRPPNGVPEKLATWLFHNINLVSAFATFLVLVVVVFFINLASKKIQASISKDVFATLRNEGMTRGLQLDPSSVPKLIPGVNDAGQFATAIQQGAANVSETYGYVLQAGQYVFALVTTVYLIWTKSWAFALCCLLMVSAQVLISIVQAKRLREKRKALDKKRNELVGHSDDILGKREIIAAFEQEENFVAKLNTITRQYATIDKELDVQEQKYKGLAEVVSDYSRLLILAVALLLTFSLGWSAVSNVGDVFFMISIYTKIYVPVQKLVYRYDSFKRSEATSDTYLAVLRNRQPAQAENLPALAELARGWKEGQDIRFENVSFGYTADPGQLVLNNCSFTIPGGKTTLLLGPSGCGKSTIAKLLLKFWPVQIGAIRMGGGEIRLLSPSLVRSHMSYVSQGDFVVDDTIEENLSWGYSTGVITKERMREIVNQVGVKKVPGYNDILEVPAKKLSLGQQQRLSMARMMLDESEIVIMDEPLAGVDIFTVRDLMPVLKELVRERNNTVLMISHRLAFAGFADQVLVMNAGGRIEESGSPLELLEKGGLFAKLYQASVEELTFAT